MTRLVLTTDGGGVFALERGRVEVAHFGRGDGKQVQIRIARPHERWISRVAGTAAIQDFTWSVTASQRWAPVSVFHDLGETLLYRGETGRFPWSAAHIEIRSRFGWSHSLKVEAAFSGMDESGSMSTGSIDTDPPAEGGFKQFYAVLVLCEPKLRNFRSAHVPTNSEIADRLDASGLVAAATSRQVHRWLDDERTRLAVPPVSERAYGQSFLQDHAIRVGRVQRYHLSLLGG